MKQREISRLLPEVFQRTDRAGSPLRALLTVMESMTEPAEEILQQVPAYFNPYTAPENFLPFLAYWVDLDRFFPAMQQQNFTDKNVTPVMETGRLREMIAAATQFSKLRGTAAGLRLFLEMATGIQGFEIEENVLSEQNQVLPFHIHIRAPQTAHRQSGLIERIIEQEKPAYVTFSLEFIPNNMEKNNGQDS